MRAFSLIKTLQVSNRTLLLLIQQSSDTMCDNSRLRHVYLYPLTLLELLSDACHVENRRIRQRYTYIH